MLYIVNMKNSLNYKKAFVFAAAAIVVGINFSYAQATSTVNDKSDQKLELSLPIQQSDLILFYGQTSDTDTNAKIDALRSEFITKFQALKDEYKKDFESAVGDKEVFPGTGVETIKDNTMKEVKSTVKTPTKSTKITPQSATVSVPNTKKYMTADKKESDIVISVPSALNIVNDKSILKPEASTWFQKIKALFSW